jgi:hypothetical protein
MPNRAPKPSRRDLNGKSSNFELTRLFQRHAPIDSNWQDCHEAAIWGLVPSCVNQRMSQAHLMGYRHCRASGSLGQRSEHYVLDARFRGGNPIVGGGLSADAFAAMKTPPSWRPD